jgi:outer membrane protein OmpA-like peptidoglycan-associated protein
MTKGSLSFLLCLVAASAGDRLQAEPVTKDLAGSDHPLLKRYEGSFIVAYSTKEFDEYKLPLGKALNPSVEANAGQRIAKQNAIEGRITRITYFAPKGRSAVEIFRNYEKELKAQQAETLFAGSGPDELGYTFGMLPQYDGIDGQLFSYSHANARFGAYKIGEVYAVVYVAEFEYGATHHPIEKGQCAVQVDIIEAKPMEAKMVAVDATEMAQQIASMGRVALYGILFDSNKTEIKPESEQALSEIAKLLVNRPALNVLVVGHTDSVGGFESNRTLSQKRADAIVARLVTKHQVAAARLFPVGVSFASPVATNSTDEGRAKNRRVELVEMPAVK